MGNVNTVGIWTPDEDDLADPEVWSAAMADSIAEGLGVRVENQERFEGAFLNIADAADIGQGAPGSGQSPLPFAVAANVAFLNGDLTLSGGVLKVVHPGLYNVSATVSVNLPSTDPLAYVELTLFKNSQRHGQDRVYKDSGAPAARPLGSLKATATMRCVEGDTIWASAFQYFGDTSQGQPSLNVDFALFNTLSVALTQAV